MRAQPRRGASGASAGRGWSRRTAFLLAAVGVIAAALRPVRSDASAFVNGHCALGATLRLAQQRGSERDVSLGALKRLTKKLMRARNIAFLVKHKDEVSFSTKTTKKMLKKSEIVARKDSDWDEFLGFMSKTPVGGDYVMPVDAAREVLAGIYGDGGNTLKQFQEDISKKEFKGFEEMRRKPNPSQVPPAKAKKARFDSGHIPGVTHIVGTFPKAVLENPKNMHGISGGCADQTWTDVWVSGSSVSYDFDPSR